MHMINSFLNKNIKNTFNYHRTNDKIVALKIRRKIKYLQEDTADGITLCFENQKSFMQETQYKAVDK